MNPSYFLFLITFLVFPIIGLILSKCTTFRKSSKFFKALGLFFLVHNILFAAGYSVRGDYFDYIVFSLEYLAFWVGVYMMLKAEKPSYKIFRVLGLFLILINYIIGFLGIFLFIVISQEYEADKVFDFESDGKNYETRRYSFGFVTFDKTRYNFETYAYSKYLPFEKKIDETDFFDTETNLIIGEDELKISIVKTADKERILFRSTNGYSFFKTIN